MLRHEDIAKVSEIKTEFGQSAKVVDQLLHWLRFFDFTSVHSPLSDLKSKGYKANHLLAVLVALPFINHASVHALLKSGISVLSEAKKDAYYRLKNRDDINWHNLLRGFVNQFDRIVEKSGEAVQGRRALVIDDTLLAKKGKVIEGVGRLWDHVSNQSVLGLRLLVLGYFDGKSFLPVNFTFHREKGKNFHNKPFGLTKTDYKNQFKRIRAPKSPQSKNKNRLNQDKMTSTVRMIKAALKHLEVDYLLMDSWFTSKQFIDLAHQHKVNLIGMVKMGKMNYSFEGEQMNASALLNRFKRKPKRCKKLSSHYIEIKAELDSKPIKLFFSRFGKGKWHLLLCTDMSLSYLQMMKLYQIRWGIEVFFKEAKQYLNLGKSQSTDFSAQVADTAITMIQYVLLTLKKRFSEYETKGGVFRAAKTEVISLTIDQRLWSLMLQILAVITDFLQMAVDDIENLMRRLANLDSIKKLAQTLTPKELKPMCET